MKVEGVGMGCTLIHRSVVPRMLEKFPELIDERIELHPAKDVLRQGGANRLLRFFEKYDLKERGIVSEDLSFCLRWRECGGEVWAAIGWEISHVGQHDFKACYLDEVRKAQLAQAEEERRKASLDQHPYELDVPQVPPEIASVSLPAMQILRVQ